MRHRNQHGCPLLNYEFCCEFCTFSGITVCAYADSKLIEPLIQDINYALLKMLKSDPRPQQGIQDVTD